MDDKKIIDKYNTIIWDWNGTLLNDVWLCVDIVNQILKNHNNLQLDEKEYKEVFGFPITDYYKKLGIDLDKEPFDVLTKKFISSYEYNVRKCQLHQMALTVLQKFHHNNIDQYILTAAHKESVKQLADYHSIKYLFNEIEGLDNHRAESKVSIGKQLINNHKISLNNAILIGDTNHDFEVANKIGIDCILIANGHQTKERLINETKGKVTILNNLGELLKED